MAPKLSEDTSASQPGADSPSLQSLHEELAAARLMIENLQGAFLKEQQARNETMKALKALEQQHSRDLLGLRSELSDVRDQIKATGAADATPTVHRPSLPETQLEPQRLPVLLERQLQCVRNDLSDLRELIPQDGPQVAARLAGLEQQLASHRLRIAALCREVTDLQELTATMSACPVAADIDTTQESQGSGRSTQESNGSGGSVKESPGSPAQDEALKTPDTDAMQQWEQVSLPPAGNEAQEAGARPLPVSVEAQDQDGAEVQEGGAGSLLERLNPFSNLPEP